MLYLAALFLGVAWGGTLIVWLYDTLHDLVTRDA